MKAMLLSLVAWMSVTLPASSQSADGAVICQSTTTCDGTSCTPWSSVLEVEVHPEGTAVLSWDGAYPFKGTVVRDDGTLIVDASQDDTGSMFVMSEGGQAYFSTATDFEEYILGSFYSLSCSR